MKPSTKTKTESPPFESTTASKRTVGLREKVYGPKKARTLELVKQAVQALREEGRRVSLAAISRKTKETDPQGQGVSESAVLTNPEAYAHYKEHCTQRPLSKRTAPAPPSIPQALRPVRSDRDTLRVRQRYLRRSKTELTDRLIALEQAYRELYDRWLETQDELLTHQLPNPPAH